MMSLAVRREPDFECLRQGELDRVRLRDLKADDEVGAFLMGVSGTPRDEHPITV